MNSSEKRRLLDDVIRDPNYEAFRAEVYEGAWVEFRKQHRKSWQGSCLALAASVAALGMLWLQWESRSAHPKAGSVPAQAAPFAMATVELVSSKPLDPVNIVRSIVNRNLFVDTERNGRVEMVQGRSEPVAELSDRQLVGLFPNEPRGFIVAGGVREFIVLARK
jgi:hypothetical protein